MRAFHRALKLILALALCLGLTAVPAWAEDASDVSLIDSAALDGMIEQYIADKKLDTEKISVGYCYTATGETWFYNENKWYYSASMYKVPLMMILAEREHDGELTQESNLNGLSLAYAEESILVYSNNDFAHLMMHYIGTDRECRELYQRYSDLPIDEYNADFYDYSYFSARFMTDVMKTLYFENERFPHIIDCLKQAQPGSYFRRDMGGEYEIAQKYGSFKEFNSTAGVIYTPNPYILVVMTKDLTIAGGENVIAELAVKFRDYTLQLDEGLEQYRQEQEAERRRLEEEERLRQQEQTQTQPEPTVPPTVEPPAQNGATEKNSVPIVGAVIAAVLAAVMIAAVIVRRRRRIPVAAHSGRSGYTPKH